MGWFFTSSIADPISPDWAIDDRICDVCCISMNASMFSCFCQIRRGGISRFFCYDNIAFFDGIFKSCKACAVLSCPVFKTCLTRHQIDGTFASEMKAVSLISYSCRLAVRSILVLSHIGHCTSHCFRQMIQISRCLTSWS